MYKQFFTGMSIRRLLDMQIAELWISNEHLLEVTRTSIRCFQFAPWMSNGSLMYLSVPCGCIVDIYKYMYIVEEQNK